MKKSHLTQAYELEQENQLEKAIDLYQEILQKDAENIEALERTGLVYAQLGNIAKAEKFLIKALNLEPENPRLLSNMGNIYKKKQQDAVAINYYEKSLKQNPNYALAHNNLATIYAKKDYAKALKHYSLAVHAEPDFAAAHYNLGLLLMSQKQLDAALIQFKNVVELNPEQLDAQFYLALLYLEKNLLDEAEATFEKVLAIDANHISTLTNLGVLALKKGASQDAIEYFTKALALDNEHLEARANLAATFMHYDRFENALMHYDVLLAKDSKNIEYLYNSGVAQMALGHLNEAIEHFELLLTKDKQHFAALSNLAAIYIRLEDRVKAKLLLEQAIKANPEDRSSLHMLSALSSQKADTCVEYATNLFNNYALYYDQHVQNYLHYALPNFLVKVLDELEIHEVAKALDLGCGTGLSGQKLRDISTVLDGVDLSKKMLEVARSKSIYDHLYEDEILNFLQTSSEYYDLVTALDVIPYLGDLDEILAAIKKILNHKGYFIFTTEISDSGNWILQETARFAHNFSYLEQLFAKHGFSLIFKELVPARKQDGKDLKEYFYVIQ